MRSTHRHIVGVQFLFPLEVPCVQPQCRPHIQYSANDCDELGCMYSVRVLKRLYIEAHTDPSVWRRVFDLPHINIQLEWQSTQA